MNHLISKIVAFLAISMLLSGTSCNRFSSDSWMDERDGNVYTYILNGDLNWMTCNLNYLERSIYCNGAWVFSYDEKEYADALIKTKRSNSGVLYNWDAAMKVSPEGWRLPSVKEWQALLNGQLTSSYNHLGVYNIKPDGRARLHENFCIYSGSTFWTSDLSESSDAAIAVIINFNSDGSLDITYEEQRKNHAFYIRCVKERTRVKNITQ